MRNSFLSKLVYSLSIRLWWLGGLLNRLATLPVVGPLVEASCFDPDESQAIIIPVNEAIREGERVVLPYTLLPALIERASHRVVLEACLCRRAERCRNYPIDLGCLFLGEGASRIDASLGRPVDVEGALAHVERAMDAGLTPTILHSTLDAFMLRIPYRRMLAACFCCECCCTIRKGLREGPPAARESALRLPGLHVTVSDACTGCGLCVDVCPVQAIALVDGHATIAPSCKGCGRCATVCPADAVTLRVAEGATVIRNLIARVEARTDILDSTSTDVL